MKKAILIALLSVSCARGTELGFNPIECRTDNQAGFMIDTGRILKKTYDVLNENLDYMLTAKGFKKTTAILVPFVIVYARYFGLHPLDDVARSLLSTIGRAQAFYELQKIIGANQQLIKEIKAQPWNMFCVATVELVKSLWFKIKIPLIM